MQKVKKGDLSFYYRVQCGGHGCDSVGVFLGRTMAKALGWVFDKRGGYGWMCPKCAGTLAPAATEKDEGAHADAIQMDAERDDAKDDEAAFERDYLGHLKHGDL